MTDEVKNLVDAIVSGENYNDAFSKAWNNVIASKLETLQKEVSSNFFNIQVAEGIGGGGRSSALSGPMFRSTRSYASKLSAEKADLRKPAPAKIYHEVAFADKEKAKAEGMRFDGDTKKWYHTDSSKSEKSSFPRMQTERVNENRHLHPDYVMKFGHEAHEQWRKGFQEKNGKDAKRIKSNGDGTESDINVPFAKLHPKHQQENIDAAYAAKEAVDLHPNDMEKAAAHVHKKWMERNPKADWNAHLHVDYSKLPEDEKEKDREHVRIIKNALDGKRLFRESSLDEAGLSPEQESENKKNWEMVNHHEDQAKRFKRNDMKRSHHLDMAKEYRRKLHTVDESSELDEAVDPKTAHDILTKHGVLGKSFFDGDTDHHIAMAELSKKYKIRAGTTGKSAARAMHDHLNKQASKFKDMEHVRESSLDEVMSARRFNSDEGRSSTLTPAQAKAHLDKFGAHGKSFSEATEKNPEYRDHILALVKDPAVKFRDTEGRPKPRSLHDHLNNLADNA